MIPLNIRDYKSTVLFDKQVERKHLGQEAFGSWVWDIFGTLFLSMLSSYRVERSHQWNIVEPVAHVFGGGSGTLMHLVQNR